MITANSEKLARTFSKIMLVLFLLAVGSSAIAASPRPGRELFADAVTPFPNAPAAGPTVLRARLVEPEFSLLESSAGRSDADTLVLNLFGDTTLVATLDHVESNPSGGHTWSGHIDGVPYSSVTLVIRDTTLAGSVQLPDALYQIWPIADRVHAIQQIDTTAFPAELEPIPIITPPGAQSTPLADNGSSVDVLVVYTAAARTAVGGTVAMQAMINLAVAETNQSYANSAINQRLNLAHTAEVEYDETNFDWSATLGRLAGTTDGYMDNVHALRNAHCADEVALIVADTEYCGIAYLMTSVSTSFASAAFAVVSRQCATGYYSFGHELGHNMGTHHDWYVNTSTAPYAYNHGYVNAADRWRTIMAYNTECSDQGFNCTRLQYWSHPSISYGGDPMGVPAGTSTSCTAGVPNPHCDADNHLVLNNTAFTVANFRDSTVCAIPPSHFVHLPLVLQQQ